MDSKDYVEPAGMHYNCRSQSGSVAVAHRAEMKCRYPQYNYMYMMDMLGYIGLNGYTGMIGRVHSHIDKDLNSDEYSIEHMSQIAQLHPYIFTKKEQLYALSKEKDDVQHNLGYGIVD